MRLWLPSDIHLVAIDEDVVFLDTAADAYFCLTGATEMLSIQDDGAIVVSKPEAADPLIEAGLLTSTLFRTRAPPPSRPTVGLSASPRAVSPPAWVRAVRANTKAAQAIGELTFQQLLALARSPVDRSAAEEEADAALLAESARFARMAPWLPKDGVCLLRSLQQLLYLRSLGHRPRWVFGVRTWPFDAHCWLQLGDVVLDDHIEHVQAFTPILAV
ncbi:lasso peptide biosynthesis B2 protein [Caulobacter sp. CCH5-E12]|uniref:lasso peptide biosynthesis B2 protein n=1 Tax=Caulobacter sp. CCH5-E12 TaxID=1768770 RepID=UPI0007814723|nr:lasso peptide biosynthesis B2 protein [Caulobacter sp. CCH5-E12]